MNVHTMNVNRSWASSEIVEFVRDKYTLSGVTACVDTVGRCVLTMPSDYPNLTSLVRSLEDEFDAVCDLASNPNDIEMIVWPRFRLKPGAPGALPSVRIKLKNRVALASVFVTIIMVTSLYVMWPLFADDKGDWGEL
jgi:hypothetical protein